MTKLVHHEIRNTLKRKQHNFRDIKRSLYATGKINTGAASHHNYLVKLTRAMLGFSKGGLPKGPSTDGVLMFRIHFRSN